MGKKKKCVVLATLLFLVLTPVLGNAALSFTKIFESAFGDQKVASFTVSFDSSYPTGGETLTPGNLGFSGFNAVIPEGNLLSGLTPVYDHSNQKLKMISAPDIEVPDTTNLTNHTVRIFVIGW